VAECRTDIRGWKKYFELWKIHGKLRGQYDAMIVGISDSRFMIVFAKLLCRKPVIWDPLFSLYDAWVLDRKLARPRSGKALYYWLVDWIGCISSDLVFLDTNANINYFVKTFKISRQKFSRILVGADDNVFYPRQRTENKNKFIVHFHGKYIPIQGVKHIVRAAKILESDSSIRFNIIGSGQKSKKIRALAQELSVPSITFLPRMSIKEIAEYVTQADICLGLLGDVPRVMRAIPNKFYEAAASARPCINADTPALREVFTSGKDTIVCLPGDPEDLARKILFLKNNPEVRQRIANAAYDTFQDCATPKHIGESVRRNVEAFLAKK
jgi:glycosyltransferase involved in cell wall biosynthesis